MQITATKLSMSTTPSRRRGIRIAVGVALCVEAFVSPIACWGVFLVGSFVLIGNGSPQLPAWLDTMGRLGNLGVLVLFVPLAGSALVMFVPPKKGGKVAAIMCFAGAILNLLPAIAFVFYNSASSTGPIGPRFVACSRSWLFDSSSKAEAF